MENLREQYESELKNLEIQENEELTVKLVTRKFKKKALRVHSDKTGSENDEEFKQLLNDYNRVKEAINEITKDANQEDCDKSNLQHFFDKHNFAKEFSQSWTIFVEKNKVEDWKKELNKRFPDPKELQGNGMQYKTMVDERTVSITFYSVEIPKMNVQGYHACIRKFVLDTLPDVYTAVREAVDIIEPLNIENAHVKAPKIIKTTGETSFKCEVCGRAYVKKNNLDKHMQLKHQEKSGKTNEVVTEASVEIDRSKDNCPTCELPKGKTKAISCQTCKINIHVECVAVDAQKLSAYKKGEIPYKCEECYWNIAKPRVNNSEDTNIPQESIVIDDEETDHSYRCNLCEFDTNAEKIMEKHVLDTHLFKCDMCVLHFQSQGELGNHKKEQHPTDENEEDVPQNNSDQTYVENQL